MVSDASGWREQNRDFLVRSLNELRARLEGSGALKAAVGESAQLGGADALAAQMTRPPSLTRLVEVFGLSDFERELVLLCLSQEMDAGVGPGGVGVTVAWAMESLPGAHWSAFDPTAMLRRWQMISLDASVPFATAGLRLDADVLAFLLGSTSFPFQGGYFRVPARPGVVFQAQVDAALRLVNAASLAFQRTGEAPVVEISGASDDERLALAIVFTEILDSRLMTVDLPALPSVDVDLDHLLLRWTRYSRLENTHLLIRDFDAASGAWTQEARMRRLLSADLPLVLVSVPTPATVPPHAPLVRHHTAHLTAEERHTVWQDLVRIAGIDADVDGDLGNELWQLAQQFRLGPGAIAGICTEASAVLDDQAADDDETAVRPDVYEVARVLREGSQRSIRARLEPVAERVALVDVPDIELPERQHAQLEQLKQEIHFSYLVNDHWGMGRGDRAAALALFAGPSGTGKTHAARVLARDLGLDLYRVDIAGVLSKWIGETEKNLRAIFDAASLGGAILLFDEADALFGKRSEVRDSHDRYANLSTSYLLQQVEHASVPTILTSNMKDALDPAFMRRLHFVIEFPFPSLESRERIWRSAFPEQVPTELLQPQRLAQLVVAGGTIRNVSHRAAFMAAARGGPVTMDTLRESALGEVEKLERSLGPDELTGW
jgi:ATPase family associated with various cellular activities (AAA)